MGLDIDRDRFAVAVQGIRKGDVKVGGQLVLIHLNNRRGKLDGLAHRQIIIPHGRYR